MDPLLNARIESAKELYQWRCAICYDTQSASYVCEEQIEYVKELRKREDYVADCKQNRSHPVPLNEQPQCPPPFSLSLLNKNVCGDCDANGMEIGSKKTVRVADAPSMLILPMVETILGLEMAGGDTITGPWGGGTVGERRQQSPDWNPREIGAVWLRENGITEEYIQAAIEGNNQKFVSSTDESLFTKAGPLNHPQSIRPRKGITGAPRVGITFDNRTLKHDMRICYDDDKPKLEPDDFLLPGEDFRFRHPDSLPVDFPERPDRVRAAVSYLAALDLLSHCVRVSPREATTEEIDRCVQPEHKRRVDTLLKRAEALPEDHKLGAILTGDTYWSDGTREAASVALGSTIEMVQSLANGVIERGVALIRPPGHHACGNASQGFCMYNNLSGAIRSALVNTPGLERVLVLDWDIHHGDGTQSDFYDDPRVMFISIHRYDRGHYYPASGHPSSIGSGKGTGYNVNIGLDGEWHGDAEYITIMDHLVMPLATSFDPQLVLVSCGFDAARGDPLGDFDITPAGYAQMTHRLLSLANGRVGVVLEGGYNLKSIATSTAAIVRVLLGEPPMPLSYYDCNVNRVAQRMFDLVTESAESSELPMDEKYNVPALRPADAIEQFLNDDAFVIRKSLGNPSRQATASCWESMRKTMKYLAPYWPVLQESLHQQMK